MTLHLSTFLLSWQPPLTLLLSKKGKNKITVVTTGSRLPEPYPLPMISERTKDIISRGYEKNRFFLLREVVTFYEGICPNPTSDEYTAMSKTLPRIP